MKTRFIEVDFPVGNVSVQSAREKSIRHGHISTLHIWWARRPLASSRASIYASLINHDSSKNVKAESEYISKMAEWESSLNSSIINKAIDRIRKDNGGSAPKVLDPFSGGGSIPLEALRLGCDSYANDLNPVAVIVEKCTLEYPQKYGHKKIASNNLFGESTINPLYKDVKKWGDWVYGQAEKSLAEYYPSSSEGLKPIGYIWAHSIKCGNPSCGCNIPLIKQTWLAKNEKNKIAYKIIPNGHSVNFQIIHGQRIDFDPKEGTVSRAKVICPCCGYGITDKEIRSLFKAGKSNEMMIAVISNSRGGVGKEYKVASTPDYEAFQRAILRLEKVEDELSKKIGINIIPDEPTPEGQGSGAERAFSLRNYGMNKWGDVFNPRQKLSIITFAGHVRAAYNEMIKEGYEPEYAKVVTTYLAIILDRLVDKNSNLVVYNVVGEKIEHVFGRQTLSMVWDYVELNPFTSVGWPNMEEWVLRSIEHCSQVAKRPGNVTHSSATSLTYPDNYFDAVITDPPYYDNVPYSYLSDYFYVWLKRTIGHLYPELFSTPLTPKGEEIVTYSNNGGYESGKKFFEDMLSKAFTEIFRVLKPEGIACIVFAHKSTEAWETIINALNNAGLYLTASWPINTERKARLRGRDSAALSSSIYMVCRKRTNKQTAYFSELKPQIERRIQEKLDQFWEEGIGGSDLFISAIGPAMEVFGKYDGVEKLSGERVSASELLEFVRRTVSEYALSRILKNPNIGDIDVETRFYLLWRWTYDSVSVDFDGARLLAQAVGFELTEHWSNGFLEKKGEQISVLDAKSRERAFLERGRYDSMIDVLHASLLFWEMNNKKEIFELLSNHHYLHNNTFWQVAQAISEVLPEGEKEKQMLQGFIYGKDSYNDRDESTKLEKGQKSLEGWI